MDRNKCESCRQTFEIINTNDVKTANYKCNVCYPNMTVTRSEPNSNSNLTRTGPKLESNLSRIGLEPDSSSFNPMAAIYSDEMILPDPGAPIFENVEEFVKFFHGFPGRARPDNLKKDSKQTKKFREIVHKSHKESPEFSQGENLFSEDERVDKSKITVRKEVKNRKDDRKFSENEGFRSHNNGSENLNKFRTKKKHPENEMNQF